MEVEEEDDSDGEDEDAASGSDAASGDEGEEEEKGTEGDDADADMGEDDEDDGDDDDDDDDESEEDEDEELDGDELVAAFPVGAVVPAKVFAVRDYGVLMQLQQATGIVAPHHFGSQSVEEGEEVQVRVLHVNSARAVVNLSLRDELVQAGVKMEKEVAKLNAKKSSSKKKKSKSGVKLPKAIRHLAVGSVLKGACVEVVQPGRFVMGGQLGEGGGGAFVWVW